MSQRSNVDLVLEEIAHDPVTAGMDLRERKILRLGGMLVIQKLLQFSTASNSPAPIGLLLDQWAASLKGDENEVPVDGDVTPP